MTARRCWSNVRAGLAAGCLTVGLVAGSSLVAASPAFASTTTTTVSSWSTLSTAVDGCASSSSRTVTLGGTITESSGANLSVPQGCALM